MDAEGGEAQEAAAAHPEVAEGRQAGVASGADLVVEGAVEEVLVVGAEVHQEVEAEDEGYPLPTCSRPSARSCERSASKGCSCIYDALATAFRRCEIMVMRLAHIR